MLTLIRPDSRYVGLPAFESQAEVIEKYGLELVNRFEDVETNVFTSVYWNSERTIVLVVTGTITK